MMMNPSPPYQQPAGYAGPPVAYSPTHPYAGQGFGGPQPNVYAGQQPSPFGGPGPQPNVFAGQQPAPMGGPGPQLPPGFLNESPQYK